jgi:hypothetical protein
MHMNYKQYPPPFRQLLSYLSVVSLDFLAFECLTTGNQNGAHFLAVYIYCFVPILLAFFIVCLALIRIQLVKAEYSHVRFSEKTRIKNQHYWLLLFLSYLVLPPITSKQLQNLDCITLYSGETFLREHTVIECDSDEYKHFRIVLILFIIAYQAIPLFWITQLYMSRRELDPVTSNHDENLALYIRDHNEQLSPLKFLFVDYRCSKWWFEVVEMYRRIAFIDVIPLLSAKPATRASIGCILAMISVAYFREKQPYRVEFTNVIANIAQV